MSTWNHIRAYTPFARELLNSGENAPAEPFLEPPKDIREFWRLWMTRATYPWESDGFPYWSHLHHARSYWDFRHLPNLLFLHYNDLKADLPGETTVWRNRVTRGDVQLRLGRDGRWYRFTRTGLGWVPSGPGSVHPVDVLS